MSALAGPPPAGTSVPGSLRSSLELGGFSGVELTPVWRNSVGGLTCAITPPRTRIPAFYVKWNPLSSGESLSAEHRKLDWLRPRHPAPEPVFYTSSDHHEVLVTRALPATSAVSPRWVSEPGTALRALGTGLRRLHDLPITDCPYLWDVHTRLTEADVPANVLPPAPEEDRVVICQGDPCAPNTLIGSDGDFAGHVDLARLGLADRWADLAVMTMSLEWNYPHYDESVFWQAYGVTPDQVRVQYYRDLWNAT